MGVAANAESITIWIQTANDVDLDTMGECCWMGCKVVSQLACDLSSVFGSMESANDERPESLGAKARCDYGSTLN